MSTLLLVVDYGMGNLASIANMIRKVGGRSIITSDWREIKAAKKLILPGVGSFDRAMKNLDRLGLISLLKDKASEGVPILGICLGMQLMTKGSEEGFCPGLEFVDAYAKKFRFESEVLKVPHMGWNEVELKKSSPLFWHMEKDHIRFYFVHSFAVECEDKDDILTTTKYGYEFVSSFEKNNVIGCQFHPEKSHKFGMRLFRNFVENY